MDFLSLISKFVPDASERVARGAFQAESSLNQALNWVPRFTTLANDSLGLFELDVSISVPIYTILHFHQPQDSYTITMRTSLLIAALATVLGATADSSSSSIIGYFVPEWDVKGFSDGAGGTSTAASLANINAAAATYHVGCVPNAPKSVCNYPSSITIVQGSATVSFTGVYVASSSAPSGSGYDVTVTESYECSLKSSTQSASCTMSVGMTGTVDGAKWTSSTSTKATYTTAPIAESYYQLTVTAGLSSFTAPDATKTPGMAVSGIAGSMITAAPVVAAAVAAWL
ncbi:hypothetical protein TSTA_025270 [Talaromyces stipitatus ATCC 10500]|uniref:GPI anchored cell wall protein n=1 Tax=Talaromyces stipitatus (strain ATCC 10500 / CBS 375.48 / QM 6759 / NRRL 1006) TaxID=441959 RepID=B8M4L4_TALSN|nr:uncharacterized protein TSTA_025270 [Talaromyces stipitatus ATCC 10500]EED19209.1 hypothetical protein TSTA_025270 [Talaromyces stipitatus ATCC 10500]